MLLIPALLKAEAGKSLTVSLVYRVSSRTARATQRNPVSEAKTKTKIILLPQTFLKLN